MNLIQAILLGIVEGITEFLPVSSTGHMIIVSSWMGIDKLEFTKLFEIVVQMGAILAVVVLYWRKFFDFTRADFYKKIIIGVIPALILGYIFADRIDKLLQSPLIVGIMLLAGGLVLLFVDGWFKIPQVHHEKDMNIFQALRIGFWQCLAMIPGVSRSAASIIGGMQQRLTRELAAEFSFLLAVPTMAAATGYKLLKAFKDNPEMLKNGHNLTALAVGNIVAFVVAIIAIKTFIDYLKKHGFKLFGYYRIVVGIIVIVLVERGLLV
ncbi:MAG: undecaprenyl-diphosphate phosphatase [Chitinophagaceae bacterium]|nr:MAG: undecaprenyl-diphosphate phosphatase [Chitinophagaceae bacterium]